MLHPNRVIMLGTFKFIVSDIISRASYAELVWLLLVSAQWVCVYVLWWHQYDIPSLEMPTSAATRGDIVEYKWLNHLEMLKNTAINNSLPLC